MMNVQEKTCCTRTLEIFLFEFCLMRRNLIKFSCDGGILTLESILTIVEHVELIAGSLESANSSILASCDHFKEVVGKKIRVL